MRTFGRLQIGTTVRAGLASVTALILLTSSAPAQQVYPSAEEAAAALAAAVRTGAKAEMLRVLGKGAESIVESGDKVDDAETRERFLSAYDAGHSIKTVGDKSATLLVGTDDFPFPIPLAHKGNGWGFDAAAGRQEVLARRIGRNELAAIQVCMAFVDAENDYADKDRTGNGAGIYAQRIVSSPGKKDGLFWPDDSDPSPLGELAARAAAEGYRAGEAGSPYHGYYYRILKGQGSHAAGGALSYVVGNKMIGGFALIAYPAEYGNSGVMTFMVNHAGVVYQKDLGERTAEIASRINRFDPDRSWQKADSERP